MLIWYKLLHPNKWLYFGLRIPVSKKLSSEIPCLISTSLALSEVSKFLHVLIGISEDHVRMGVYVRTAWWSNEDQHICETAIIGNRNFPITSQTVLSTICSSRICCRSSSDKSASDEMPEWYMGMYESSFHSVVCVFFSVILWAEMESPFHYIQTISKMWFFASLQHRKMRNGRVFLVNTSTSFVLLVMICWIGQELYALRQRSRTAAVLSVTLVNGVFKCMLVQTGINNLNFCIVSNGNSSTTSSLGIMDLDIYQENMSSSRTIK